MRPSSVANRTSYALGSNAQANSAATQARLLEKKKEYDAVAALDRASTQYLERITQIAEECDIMSDAGECKPV
jgi:DASH complex subunit DAD2